MLDAAGKIWSKIQEFVKDISELKAHNKETDKEIAHLKREVEILAKDVEHHAKIQTNQGGELAAFEARVKKLESEKHGLSAKLGKQRAENARLASPKLPLNDTDQKKPRPRKNWSALMVELVGHSINASVSRRNA
jgi:chromosome segregation ATPase